MVFLILFLLLTLLNAYFSSIEIAMVSVRQFQIQEAADQGSARAKQLLHLLKNPEEYLSAIQVGITLVAIVEGLYGGEVLEQYLEPRLLHWNLPLWLAHGLSLFIGVGSITYFTILLGELLPKTLALQAPRKIALELTPSFLLFTRLFYPFVQLLTWNTHILLRLFAFKSSESKKLTDADLKSVLSLAYRQGTIQEHELRLHENLFTFYDQGVGQIMTPLAGIVAIKETMTNEEINTIIKASAHNYFPVVRNEKFISGVLNAKDFLTNPQAALSLLIQPVVKVIKEDRASDVLLKLQKAPVSFAAVVENKDELIGIVTMHDIGETLLGEFA
jgi:putative hemolysin